jgi:hypothetical protein
MRHQPGPLGGQIVLEDVAHIVVHASRPAALTLLDSVMAGRGYRPYPLKGKSHLLSNPNWQSPFDPPPRYRCFLILPDQGGWTTIVDELDRLDDPLAMELSRQAEVITVRGSYEREGFDVAALAKGEVLRDPAQHPLFRSAIEAIRSEADHVTRFPYDEICLRLRKTVDLQFRGYVIH